MAKRFGKHDVIFLGILLLLLSAGSVCWFLFFGRGGAVAEVTVDGQVYGVYSLDQEQTVEIRIDGEVGNVLWIRDGKADMTEATCPDRLCVHQAAVSKEHETIVCLPHRVVVEVKGGDEADIEGVAVRPMNCYLTWIISESLFL